MLIINGIIHTPGEELPCGYVRFSEGKLTEVGPMSSCPEEDEVLDARGGHVLPGLVDAHCHLGLFGDGLGEEGEDGNEITDPCTPHLRALDGVNPMDGYFAEARRAGVTTVCVCPGSANPIAGQAVTLKTDGLIADEMLLQAPAAVKLALGENPKMCYRDREETPQTRMATAAILRENLEKAREYLRKKQKALDDPEEEPPEFDAALDALCPVLDGGLPVHIHCHRADDIATALRISREFGLRTVLVHGTEGYLIADWLAKQGAPIITGPLLTDRSKPELARQSLRNPALLAEKGVKVAICTDHPEVTEPYLMLSAALACREGLPERKALEAITSVPAELLGLSDRIGSLEAGKDADIVIYDRHPFEVSARVTAVFINGKRITA